MRVHRKKVRELHSYTAFFFLRFSAVKLPSKQTSLAQQIPSKEQTKFVPHHRRLTRVSWSRISIRRSRTTDPVRAMSTSNIISYLINHGAREWRTDAIICKNIMLKTKKWPDLRNPCPSTLIREVKPFSTTTLGALISNSLYRYLTW